jgi:hypothetical protein
MPDHLTHTQIRELAASVVEETGMGDHIKKLLDAKDETERSHVRMEWERKMADRENQRNLQSR